MPVGDDGRIGEESGMAAFDKFEIVKHGPYRFIGKSIYIGNKGSFGCF